MVWLKPREKQPSPVFALPYFPKAEKSFHLVGVPPDLVRHTEGAGNIRIKWNGREGRFSLCPPQNTVSQIKACLIGMAQNGFEQCKAIAA
ncbi:hypothetical protein ATR1_017c0038 [Acetobacter tropicalis]|nr:hypothetical protein ATR1_017c0038 [Acetobacter tropicalis]